MTWEELKDKFEVLKGIDPQRATLGSRAMAGVEDGLRYLTSVGFGFQVVSNEEAKLVKAQLDLFPNSPALIETLTVAQAIELAS